MTSELMLLILATLPMQTVPDSGSISGVVVNASHHDMAVPHVEVALRVKVDGQFVIAGETTTDDLGRFRFDDIPADPEYVYLAGANWQTVHYPGQRIQLSASQRDASVQLDVRDAVQTPDPLVVRRHEISIEREPDALKVTETLLVENPSPTTFVGLPKKEEGRAATFSLSIPSDFVRTTFHDEFFGRHFALIDGKLVTDVPWTPGEREVTFTYVVPDPTGDRVWERRLDLPTSALQVLVKSETARVVNPRLLASDSHRPGVLSFSAEFLPAGDVIRIDLNSRSQSIGLDVRWLALAVLVTGILVTTLRLARGVRKSEIGGALRGQS